jgi:ADP-ribose pyrophosphatase
MINPGVINLYDKKVVSLRGVAGETDVELLNREIGYQGFFRLERYQLSHRLFAGEMSPVITRELFERGHAAAVLLYDATLDRVVLVEQFRIGALNAAGGAWLYEIVAGIIEPGEEAEAVARRESVEEAGCEVGHIEKICDYLVSPGGTSETISLYCGQVDSRGVGGIHGLDHEDEDIRVFSVSYAEAVALLAAGELNSASPIMALQWLQLNRARLRAAWLAA